MTIQPGDVIEVSARAEFNGVDDIVNVFQFQHDGVAPLADNLGIDDVIEFIEAFYTIIITGLTALQLFRDLTIRNKTQETLLGVHSWATLTAGESEADPIAPGVAFLLGWSTPIPRVGMRKYIGVVTDPNMDTDGTFAPVLTGAGATMVALMLVPYEAVNSTWSFGYLSPKTSNFEIPTGGIVTDIPAYQRRRKQGRGS